MKSCKKITGWVLLFSLLLLSGMCQFSHYHEQDDATKLQSSEVMGSHACHQHDLLHHACGCFFCHFSGLPAANFQTSFQPPFTLSQIVSLISSSQIILDRAERPPLT
jgi:hypothetical protein